MDRSSVISLISQTVTSDAYGIQRTTEVKREVFCDVSSVSLSEWSEGGRLGLNPEFRMTMFAPDYNGETILEFEGVRYSIYRTYRGRNESIDLYVEKRTGTAQEVET